jgi:hypothetical protein
MRWCLVSHNLACAACAPFAASVAAVARHDIGRFVDILKYFSTERNLQVERWASKHLCGKMQR